MKKDLIKTSSLTTRIKIIGNYHENFERQTNLLELQASSYTLTYKSLFNTDVLVVLNDIPQKHFGVYFPKKTLLIMHEPPVNDWSFSKSLRKTFDYVLDFWEDESINFSRIDFQPGLPWHDSRNYTELAEEAIPIKTAGISMVVSTKSIWKGHKQRLLFLDELKKHELDITYFGRGINFVEKKEEALKPFRYSIAIENYSCKNYFTEKITDCFLSYTLPIYYGATNIQKFFPKESYIQIDLNKLQYSIDKIKDVMRSNYWEENVNYISEAREMALTKYNTISNIIQIDKKFMNSGKRKLVVIFNNKIWSI